MGKGQEIKIHPIAERFPEMGKDEYLSLKESIRSNGLREPVTLLNGMILDGRHRARACEELGIAFETRDFNDSNPYGSPWVFVWDENAERRHLAQGTKASLWLEFESGDEQWNAEQLAAKASANEARSETQKGRPKKRSGSSGTTTSPKQHKTRKARAKRSGVPPGTQAKAETLKRNAPDLHAQVCVQKMSLVQAYRIFRERKREAKRTANAAKVADVKDVTEAIPGVFSTIVIDPPWDFGDEGDINQFGRGKHDYASMSIEKISKLPVGKMADSDCHIYLWITNRSLPKGFDLLEKWGFRYVTCLTWCKPSIGVGNYFRGSTEQVLFGVRGTLPLKRKNVGTWFAADRPKKQHSAKPDLFFKLVESCSPGPYLEMFSRIERAGWKTWGESS